MTTIVAIQRETEVELAWDSRVSVGGDYTDLKQPKVVNNRGLIFAVAGPWRATNVLQTTAFPEYDGSDSFTWVITHVIPVIKQAAQETGWFDEEEGRMLAAVLLVLDGEVYSIGQGLSVDSHTGPFNAIGSGADYALGALAAGATAEEAVNIAAGFDSYSGGRVTVAKDWELIDA